MACECKFDPSIDLYIAESCSCIWRYEKSSLCLQVSVFKFINVTVIKLGYTIAYKHKDENSWLIKIKLTIKLFLLLIYGYIDVSTHFNFIFSIRWVGNNISLYNNCKDRIIFSNNFIFCYCVPICLNFHFNSCSTNM